MSLLNPYGIFTGGIDLQAEQARSDKADADLRALNERALDTGHWSQDTFDHVEAFRNSRNTNGIQVEDEVSAAAKEGAIEGLTAIPGAVRNSLTTGLGFTLSFIPWWVWVAAIGYGLIQLGAINKLRKAFL